MSEAKPEQAGLPATSPSAADPATTQESLAASESIASSTPATSPAPASTAGTTTTTTTSATGTSTSEKNTSSSTSTNENEKEKSKSSEPPQVVPASAIHGGRETSDRVLYVGNLDKSITEDILKQYFQVAGQISEVKIMVDKKNSHVNYAFVEYLKTHDAKVALQTLNGIQIENNRVKINWAFQSQQNLNDENTFNLFVGDLNVDVDDEALRNIFKDFPTYIQAHVMWDMQTGRSRGYGFVSFGDKEQAQNAMNTLQGKEISGRPVRINWATKRENNKNNNNGPRRGAGYRGNNNYNYNNNNNSNQYGGSNSRGNSMMPPLPPSSMPMSMTLDSMVPGLQTQPQGMQIGGGQMPQGVMGGPPPPPHMQQQQQRQQGQRPTTPMVPPPPVNPQAIDDMIRRAPPGVTTAYIGNIPHFATEADLIPLLQNFGFILDFSYYPEKGCCFIKYDTHEQAAVCIVALANFNFQGRNLRTGWGKERNTFMPPQPQPQPHQAGMAPVMMGVADAQQMQQPPAQQPQDPQSQ